MIKEYNEHMFVCLPPTMAPIHTAPLGPSLPPPTGLTPQEEFLFFDVVIHRCHWIDHRSAYLTTFNVLPLPSNEKSF